MKEHFIDIGLTKGNAVVTVCHKSKTIKVHKMMCAGLLCDFIISNEGIYYIEDSNLSGNWHGSTSREGIGKNKGFTTAIIQVINYLNRYLRLLKPNGYSLFFQKRDLRSIFKNVKNNYNNDKRAALAMALTSSSKPIHDYLFE